MALHKLVDWGPKHLPGTLNRFETPPLRPISPEFAAITDIQRSQLMRSNQRRFSHDDYEIRDNREMVRQISFLMCGAWDPREGQVFEAIRDAAVPPRPWEETAEETRRRQIAWLNAPLDRCRWLDVVEKVADHFGFNLVDRRDLPWTKRIRIWWRNLFRPFNPCGCCLQCRHLDQGKARCYLYLGAEQASDSSCEFYEQASRGAIIWRRLTGRY